jgi:alpha-1,2-mannosyltransferase
MGRPALEVRVWSVDDTLAPPPAPPLAKAWTDVFAGLFLGFLPVVLVAAFTVGVIGDHYEYDFRGFWLAAQSIATGHSPYPAASAVAVSRSLPINYFVYPPPIGLLLVPFGQLPFSVAAALFTLILLGAVGASLWLLGVRDWRCYGAVYGCIPVLLSLRLGAINPLLLLGLAAAWRWRNRPFVVGGTVAAVVVAKLFLWPLAVWLLVTRRFKAAAIAVGEGLLVTGISWWAIGFDGLHQYPHLLSTLSNAEGVISYSLLGLGYDLGASVHFASLLPWAAAAVAAAALLELGRRRADDRVVFIAAVAAALVATPILWLHYLTLLLVPLAIVRPRFNALWAAPLVLWATSKPAAYGDLWRVVLVLSVLGLFVAACARARPEPATAR